MRVRLGIASAAAFVTLGACATTADDRPVDELPMVGGGPCDADAAQQLVGEPVSQELAVTAMRLSGARELRWIPPNSAVTMDYRPARLNIEYDEGSTVTAINCG
ncbi:hypothetical protein HFP57_03185 [Parasphingopyxis algicola]|uniref:I78 family peptidase inhibitor n=1 Tax=Parasphingopyxis algicola TaxID=2026624 RepID=UPI0015A4AD17|nr:I78 family peptidase inhibitor [Parasphingopyxis algicola]QLC24129.1 hypothetical protein HFP57_03185 [Parasphingopyxis algicola]